MRFVVGLPWSHLLARILRLSIKYLHSQKRLISIHASISLLGSGVMYEFQWTASLVRQLSPKLGIFDGQV